MAWQYKWQYRLWHTEPMGTRRSQGTGSIYQRPNGSWCGQVSIGHGAGRRRRTIYGKSRDEVAATVDRILSRPESDREAVVQRSSPDTDGSWLDALGRADAIESHTAGQWITKRDAVGCCVYCGSAGPLEPDHVIPVTRGGSNGIGNIVPSCRRCNGAKGADTAYEFIRRQLLA